MCQTVFSIVFFVVISYTCTLAIVTQTPKSEVLTRLYEAMIDVSKSTCKGNPRKSAVGVVDDSEGSILKTLTRLCEAMIDVSKTCNSNPRRSAVGVVGDWRGSSLKKLQSNDFIPAVLTDTRMKIDNSVIILNLPKLQVFVIAATSSKRFLALMEEITNTIWWANEAYFLKLNPTSNTKYQCSNIDKCPYTAFEEFGVLNTQFICFDHTMNEWIFNSNRFARRTPKFWEFLPAYEKMFAPFSVFERIYRNGGQSCQSLNLAKTAETGDYPFYLVAQWPWLTHQVVNKFNKLLRKAGSNLVTWIEYLVVLNKQFFIDNIAIGLKPSALLMENSNNIPDAIALEPSWISPKNGLFGVRQL